MAGTDKIDGAPSEVGPLVKKRGTLKRKVTLAFKYGDNDTTIQGKISLVSNVEEFNDGIKLFNDKINDIYESIEEQSVVNAYEKEFNSQTAYALNIETKLVELRTYIKINTEGRPVNTTVCETKLPNLQCVVFSGENTNSSDFVAFITQFKNVVGCRTNLSNSAKLTYLISYLKGCI
jgi:Ni,Fe-hydrogenase III large subunit